MKPRDTFYRLANSPKDYAACHAIAEQQGLNGKSFTWPTVVAVRDEQIIGFLATAPSKTALIAGPLCINLPRPTFVALRLVEAYENVLRAAGVTSYFFAVMHDQPDWQRSIEDSLQLRPWQVTKTENWYQKAL